jgi:hypothetical protein
MEGEGHVIETFLKNNYTQFLINHPCNISAGLAAKGGDVKYKIN